MSLQAAPLHDDGSFLNADGSVASEVAANVWGTLVTESGTVGLTGQGFCETVGFEVPAAYRTRALSILGVGPLST